MTALFVAITLVFAVWIYRTQERPIDPTLAEDPSTPSDVLITLSRHEGWSVRRDVAANPNTIPETLAFLANDPVSRIRCAVAKNPNTSPETLVSLRKDVYGIRWHVAHNPSTPYGVWIHGYGRVIP